jgi:hypothetical protein
VDMQIGHHNGNMAASRAYQSPFEDQLEAYWHPVDARYESRQMCASLDPGQTEATLPFVRHQGECDAVPRQARCGHDMRLIHG